MPSLLSGKRIKYPPRWVKKSLTMRGIPSLSSCPCVPLRLVPHVFPNLIFPQPCGIALPSILASQPHVLALPPTFSQTSCPRGLHRSCVAVSHSNFSCFPLNLQCPSFTPCSCVPSSSHLGIISYPPFVPHVVPWYLSHPVHPDQQAVLMCCL